MNIVLFFVSMFVLALLLLYKAFEIKVRRIHLVADTFKLADDKIHKFIELCMAKYNHYKKVVAIFFSEFLPSYMYELLIKTKDYVSKKYYSAGDEFRGRRMLRSNGSVSFFLERLAEEKAQTNVNEV